MFRAKYLLLASLPILVALAAIPANAAGISLPPQAAQALDQIYSGDSDAGIATAHTIEQSDPRNPLGYAIEAEAFW